MGIAFVSKLLLALEEDDDDSEGVCGCTFTEFSTEYDARLEAAAVLFLRRESVFKNGSTDRCAVFGCACFVAATRARAAIFMMSDDLRYC